jgi:dTDP-4-dehydrorhamnose reductase
MKKLFITGGSGFVSGHLVHQSIGKWRVTTNYYKHPIAWPGIDSFYLDLNQQEKVAQVFDQLKPDVVLHQAALSNLDFCEQYPDKARTTNVEATAFLAKWCQSASARLVFLSSDMVYDGERGNYCENDPVRPLGIYAMTKVQGEYKIRELCCNYAIIRTALVYGKPIGGGSSFTEWMERLLRQGQQVPLYTDQYRTPILVNNLAEVLLEISEGDFVGTLNVGGPDKMDRYRFGQKYCHLGGFDDTLLRPITMSNGLPLLTRRPSDLSFNITKAESILKTKLLGIDEGLNLLFAK